VEIKEKDDLITVEGVIEGITYQNEENGYTVCDLGTEDNDLITLVGIMPYTVEGEIIKAVGKWEVHQSYGRQFKVEYYEKTLPQTEASILKYLSSRSVKGIGPVIAGRIVERFGKDTFNVLEEHPELLCDIQGITAKKAQEMSESFKAQFGLRSVMMFCREHFGVSTAVKIYKCFGSGAIDIIKRNPYLLCEKIYGIGFERADNFAKSLGIEGNNKFRIMSGIKYALSYNASNNGHTFIPEERLTKLAADLLRVELSEVKDALITLLEEQQLVCRNLSKIPCIYLPDYYDAENYICEKLMQLDSLCKRTVPEDIYKYISFAERESDIEYAPMQKKAIFSAVNDGVMILTGGPGTGKTTIVKAIIKIFERMGYKVALAAPTGRAAKRMSEATGYEAKTVHRMLEVEFSSDDKQRFRRDENCTLDENVIIIDEASMMDTLLTCSLLKAIKPGSHLIFIGDSDQLPSVGAGNVLCDIKESDVFSCVCLTDIFRQAEESRIVTNAHLINSGEMPVLTDKRKDFFFIDRYEENKIVPTIVDLCTTRLPGRYGNEIRDMIQVITPSRKGIAGTEVLNETLQRAINRQNGQKHEKKMLNRIFRVGDKVMQIRNNYDIIWRKGDKEGSGIFNGDIGVIEIVDNAREKIVVNFDERHAEYDFTMLDELEHAYAITVHKSQGSEYPVVIIPMFDYTNRLMTRNLLYTAVTRAQKMVILVGRADVIYGMVQNDKRKKRYTALKYLLCAYAPEQVE